MPRHWTAELSEAFWRIRQWILIDRHEDLENKIRQMHEDARRKNELRETQYAEFEEHHINTNAHPNAETHIGEREAGNLRFWMEHLAWSVCDDCKELMPLKLLPSYSKRPVIKPLKTCTCKAGRYLTPTPTQIPDVLKNMSLQEICALRPLTIHTGEYIRSENGYRKKSGIFRLTWNLRTVEDQIAELPDPLSRQRCTNAYTWLMSSDRSSYRDFVLKRPQMAGKRFNVYDNREGETVECCLWPSLYPFKEWCDTSLHGNESRLSTKVSFLMKVGSIIADYSISFELLHFHYDMWLFKTVSGAIASGKRLNCSPARALETKTFSVEFWKWQHRFLLDAVQQFGHPTVFITISPYEWSFPFPPWLESLRNITGRGPTQLAGHETFHIIQVLEQIVRGYLCGSNSNRWNSHVFQYNGQARHSNVNTYFYRFEYQNRGTVHLHLLVWLKNLKKINKKVIRADIPWRNLPLAFHVQNLQASDKSSLQPNESASTVTEVNGADTLQLFHPAEAFAKNLRAYISTLVPSLSCRMDIQMSDGQAMILRYVTSYVAKWHDSYENDAMYSVHVGPFQAAYRHMKDLAPLEPEMWMALSAKKISWTSSRTKKYRVPFPNTLVENRIHQKYCLRPRNLHTQNFLQWLRKHDETKRIPQAYRNGETLVGTKTVSPLKDIFMFQHLLMHHPHTSVEQLYHRDHEELPVQIKFFAAASTSMPELWKDKKATREYFNTQGHNSAFVETLVNHVHSLNDFFNLWQRQVLSGTNEQVNLQQAEQRLNDPLQTRVLDLAKRALESRDHNYDDMNICESSDSDEEDNCEDEEGVLHGRQLAANIDEAIDWKKPILVTGKPGTGKTRTVFQVIEDARTIHRPVLVATPTGFLATLYTAHFGEDVPAETVHSAFHYPVSQEERAQINWDLSRYDLIVIDEVSMIPRSIFTHITRTLNEIPVRPVLLLCGDKQQLQPIETVENRTVQVNNILNDPTFLRIVNHVNLTNQYRCEDEEYQSILNHLRYFRPSQTLLRTLHNGRTICQLDPTDDDIYQAMITHPTATILTVSRAAANRVNDVAVRLLFDNEVPLAHIQSDSELPPIPLYRNMRVIITQNRDKANGVVNGQKANVHMVHNQTVFLKLPNGAIVNTYPITSIKEDGSRKTVFPFMPCYAVTICKAQGQTLSKIIVWLDTPCVPGGAAYVALSRVRRAGDLFFLSTTSQAQYSPVGT